MFPYGNIEPFLETEIEIISQYFSDIIVYPKKTEAHTVRKTPDNVKTNNFQLFKPYNRLILIKKNIFLISYIFLFEILKSRNRLKYIINFRKYFNYLLHAMNNSLRFEKEIYQIYCKGDIFYTYWFEYWTFVLSILKYRGKIKNLITRTHGFDLYNERRKYGFHPFRTFQLNQINAVYNACSFGKDYISRIYPKYIKKFHVSHLGIFDNGKNQCIVKDHLNIISCSNIIPLKRIHLIIDILEYVNIKVKWVHIGGGHLKDEIMKKAEKLPQNIESEFKGEMKNKEVIDFYKHNSIDVFIHVSETEGGVPVAIQEAMSFGIPVIATKVGGVPEIVNSDTGILIPKRFESKKIARIIDSFSSTKFYTLEKRKQIREYALEHFGAQKRYSEFVTNMLL